MSENKMESETSSLKQKKVEINVKKIKVINLN